MKHSFQFNSKNFFRGPLIFAATAPAGLKGVSRAAVATAKDIPFFT
jgi:hypothetical protein